MYRDIREGVASEASEGNPFPFSVGKRSAAGARDAKGLPREAGWSEAEPVAARSEGRAQ